MLKLLQIDDTTRALYSQLRGSDKCFYWREYPAGSNLSNKTDTNQLIWNFKKCPTKRSSNPNEYRWKARAISQVAFEMATVLKVSSGDYSKTLFVPVPPSKIRTNPKYDDRLEQVLASRKLAHLHSASLINQTVDIEPSHLDKGSALSVDDRKNIYTCDEMDTGAYERIIIFDDMITTGCHFVTISDILSDKFGLPIIGLFIARRIHREPDFEALFGQAIP